MEQNWEHRGIRPWINGTGLWRSIATGLAGLVVGLLLAWFTAFTGRGVTTKEMQDYVQTYSPYIVDKNLIAEHQINMAKEVGKMTGSQQDMVIRLTRIEEKQLSVGVELSELRGKIELVGKLLEQQQTRGKR